MLEYFYKRNMYNSIREVGCNKIRSHEPRMNMWDISSNEEQWRTFLTHLTSNLIQWRLPWINGGATLMRYYYYFLELIGVEGIQPYSPLMVLWQFSSLKYSLMITHGIGGGRLWRRDPHGKTQKFDWGWGGIFSSGMVGDPYCTLEYYTWYMSGEILTRPSYEAL